MDVIKAIDILADGCYVDKKTDFATKLDRDVLKHESNGKVKEFLYDNKFFDANSLEEWKSESNAIELIECDKNNVWLKYFLKKENYIVERWVDFESDISKVVQSLEYANELSTFYKNNN